MYITINKEWFEKNKSKFLEESDIDGSYMISTDNQATFGELNDGTIWISEEYDEKEQCYVSLDWTPETDTIVGLVEDSIDDIKGDALIRIIEVLVKKLNKFKSLIESVRGL